jgi:hypothetical protein
LGLDYDRNLTEALAGGVSINGRYSGRYEASGFGNPLDQQPSYVQLDASVRIKGRASNWEVDLIGKNLTDRFIVNGTLDGPSTGSGTGTPAGIPADQIGYVSLPRTVQLQFAWHY